MIIHFSILFVIIVVSLIWGPGIREKKLNSIYAETGEETFKSSIWPWLIIFGYIAFLAAMRTKMNDTSVYRASFDNLEGTWEEAIGIWQGDGKDKGFTFLASLFKLYVSDDYHMWFLFFAAIEAIALIYILRREAVSLWDACFFFFASTLYYNNFSMMRQWFAVVILFVASKFIADKKPIPYFIICILLAQIHTSALLFIIVYFLVQGEAWNKKQNIMIGIFALLMLFLQPLLSSMSSMLEDTTYDYVVNTMQSNSGSSVIRIFISAVPVVLAFINRKKVKGKMINVCVNMSLLNLMLNVLATFTSGLYIIRLATYTQMFNIILYPYLLNITLKEEEKRFIKPLFYVLYFAFYIYQMNHQGAFGYSSDVLGTFT